MEITQDEEAKRKYDLMVRIEQYERALIELSRWSPGYMLSMSTKELTGEIADEKTKDKWINVLDEICSIAKRDKVRVDGKLYLTEIINKEKPEFSQNNLILSPTGSGKTHFMKRMIDEAGEDNVLFLVSTTSLKDRLVPKSKDERIKLGNRMYTSSIKDVHGEGEYKILVMTYAEFGKRMKFTDEFANAYKYIFCDEIHSLLSYYFIDKADTLLVSIRYLFGYNDNQYKFYFTATDEYLDRIKEEASELFDRIKVFNYLDYPNIVRHMVLSSYKINRLEQVKAHLDARKESFSYFGYKSFAFCKTIESQKKLASIVESLDLNPLVLWSVNNENHKMNEEQLRQREYVLRTGLIPDGYDILIINSSMQEGWDLLDPKVKLVIMNTTNETEFVQSLGRVRQDVDILVYRVNTTNIDYYVDFPVNLINIPLTTKMKQALSEELNLRDKTGRVIGWTLIKTSLEKQGYKVRESSRRIQGKATRVSIVQYPEELKDELLL